MATQKRKIALHLRMTSAVHAVIGDEVTLQNVKDIEGIERIIYSEWTHDYLICINPLYDDDDVIAEIEALNNPTPLPDAFQE